MLYNANELVEQLVDFVDTRPDPSYYCRVMQSFPDYDVDLPLSRITVGFHCKQAVIARLINETTGDSAEHHETKIAMVCFAPYEDDVVSITKTCEEILSDIYFNFSMPVNRYTMGEIKNDDDLRSFKVECELYFEFDTMEMGEVT